MDRARLTVGELVRDLRERGMLDASGSEGILRYYSEGRDRPLAWYLQALLGAGAVVAAVSFVLFLDTLLEDSWHRLFLGLALIAGAAGLRRCSSRLPAVHFALALGLTGHILVLSAVGRESRRLLPVVLTATLLAGVLYGFCRDSLHRFLSTGTALALWICWLAQEEFLHALDLAVFLEGIALAVLFGRARRLEALRPLGWAFAVALPSTLALPLLPSLNFHGSLWPSRIVLTLGLAGLVIQTAGRENLRKEPVWLAVAGTLLLGLFTAPGILAALGLLVLGYASREKLLIGLGALAWPAFIGMFYYDLDLDLGTKSAVLAGSGALLLLGRAVLARRPWARRAVA